jgi:hypothetical protein
MRDVVSAAVVKRFDFVWTTDVSLVEILLAIGIVGLLNGIAAREYENPLNRVQFTHVFGLVQILKYETAIHYAQTGKWLSVTEFEAGSRSAPDDFKVAKMQISHGSFNMVLQPIFAGHRASNGPMEWNVSYLRDEVTESGILLWRCGYSRGSASTGAPPNLTNIPREYMPAVCRE